MNDTPVETEFKSPPAISSAWRGTANAIAVPIVVIILLSVGRFVSVAGSAPMPALDQSGDRADQVLDGVDPNTAPWWELTILPNVGEITARTIVEHRRQAQDDGQTRPFKVAADLENVHGIGPKTVERLKSLLRFDAEYR